MMHALTDLGRIELACKALLFVAYLSVLAATAFIANRVAQRHG